jgi:hypothetical protein
MVWGLELASDFGPFSPEGNFVGYAEQLEAAFSVMTDEEKAFYNNRVSTYRLHVNQCFQYEHGTMHGEKRLFSPVRENEWPREFNARKKYPKLGSLLNGVGQLLIVDADFKSILETLEPSIHQFRPIRMTHGSGEPYSGEYFTMVIGRFLSAFDPEQSPKDIWRNIGGQYSALVFNKANAAAGATKMSAIFGCHLWRDRVARHPNIFLSDALKSEVSKAGLSLPTHFQMKEV